MVARPVETGSLQLLSYLLQCDVAMVFRSSGYVVIMLHVALFQAMSLKEFVGLLNEPFSLHSCIFEEEDRNLRE